MRELKQLLNETIRRGYPELLNYDIRIEYKDFEDALGEFGELSPEGYHIEVDTSIRNADEKVKIGVIASELSHISQDIQFSFWEKLKDRLLWKLSRNYRILDERNTDIITIVRGFGTELYEAMKFGEENDFPYYKEDGLSLRELETITKKNDSID
jgi:hypothetical protein